MLRSGFSLVEMLLVVVLIGILGAIAYPAYQQYVLRSYRVEAITILLELANRQEQHLADYGQYTADWQGLGISSVLSSSGRYQVQLTLSNDNQAYVLSMHAQGAQLADTECLSYTLNQFGQRNSEGQAPLSCWE